MSNIVHFIFFQKMQVWVTFLQVITKKENLNVNYYGTASQT